MNLQKVKIYHDGSHFIAIPKGVFSSGKGCKRRVVKTTEQQSPTNESPPETPKERFETAYKESQSLLKRERKAHIKESLAADFANKDELNAFVTKHTERMRTNTIKRKVRLMRKLGLQRWDYFVTFTYNYLKEKGVKDDHIIKISLDDDENSDLLLPKALSRYIKNLITDDGLYYVLLDEIQLADNFVGVLNGLLKLPNVDI